MLHKPSKERLASVALSGEKLLVLFEAMTVDAGASDEDVIDVLIHYMEPDDEFVVGTYTPEIHLVIKKVADDV